MGVNGDGSFWQHGDINSCQKEPSPLTTIDNTGTKNKKEENFYERPNRTN